MPRAIPGILHAEDGVARCSWAGTDPEYVIYHDSEWGRETRDDVRLFEKICLEGFQSGLSWLTILRKRENFRRAFAGFDFEKVARFNERSVARLLADASIIRHRGKIEATIGNAKCVSGILDEFGSLEDFFFRYVPPASERPKRVTLAALRNLTQTKTSVRLSKDLKERGFRFVGPTTCYAFMQAMGLVNDHVEGCDARAYCTGGKLFK